MSDPFHPDPTQDTRPRGPGEDMRSAAREARRAGDRIAGEAGAAAQELKQQGAEAVEAARDQAGSLAEEGRRAGAERAGAPPRAVHAAAGELERGSPEIAHYVHRTAAAIEGFARDLRDRPPREMLRGVEDFARRQPIAFFGTAAIAGFALARFAKSSAGRAPGWREATYPDRGRMGPDNTAGTLTPSPGMGTAGAAPPGWMSDEAAGARLGTPVGGAGASPAHPQAGSRQAQPGMGSGPAAAPGWRGQEDGTATPATRAAATLGGAAAQAPGGAASRPPGGDPSRAPGGDASRAPGGDASRAPGGATRKDQG